MQACWRISWNSLAIRRNANAAGSAIILFAILWNRRAAGIARYACILGKTRSGRRAELAMYAAAKSDGFASPWRRRVRNGAESLRRERLRGLRRLPRRHRSHSRELRAQTQAREMICR